jgi:FKBP-type peptidyl-prolyl cis-trans isomerase FkpA
MADSTAPAQRSSGRSLKLWLALILTVWAGVALAYLGAGSLRGETTASGLQFRTVEEGTGELIKPVDGVLVEYEGRLPDGTVFDSSEGRGPTPMLAGQVIPGFAEALTKMQKGGRYRIVIPSSLGYGSSPPAGSPIPPDSDLEFDVHVAQVVPNAAMMQGMQGAPGGAGPEQGPPPGSEQGGVPQPEPQAEAQPAPPPQP